MTDERLDEIKTKWNIPVTLPMAVPWGKDDVVWLVGEVTRLRAEAKRADEEATTLANSDLATTEQVVRALRVELAHVRAEGAKALDQATRDMQEGARLLAEAEQRAKEWQNQCYVEVECGDGRVAAAEQRAAQAEAERDAAREEVARLLAENERLRAALHDVMGACDAECAACGAYYVAKKALDDTKEKP